MRLERRRQRNQAVLNKNSEKLDLNRESSWLKMMKKLRDETPPTHPETCAKDQDDEFFKKYKKLC